MNNFMYGFKGAPSARQPDRPRPIPRRMRWTCPESVERAGQCVWRRRGAGDSRRRWRGSLARRLQRDSAPARAAARRAAAPHRPQPHPAVTHRGCLRSASCRAVVSRQVRQLLSEGHGHRAGTPRIVRGGPSGVKGAPIRSRRQGDGRKRPPLTPETSAAPAGLTARARPEARPIRRAANLAHEHRISRSTWLTRWNLSWATLVGT
jgi:hypothetical protein